MFATFDQHLFHNLTEAEARTMASRKFEQLLSTARLGKFWSTLTRRARQLASLHDLACCTPAAQRYLGIRSVPLCQIQGSENRTQDFDRDFQPLVEHLEQRWISVAAAWLCGVRLPPVELIQYGEIYFVRDGHHRISVARALGQTEIDAVVMQWDMAQIG